MKYITQQKKYDCAGVAILNALRYFNDNTSYKKLCKLRRRLKTGKIVPGTLYTDFLEVTNKLFTINDIEHKTVNREKVLKHLETKPCFLQYPSANGNGHLVFVERYLPGQNKVIFTNSAPRMRLMKFTPQSMERIHFCILLDSMKT